MTDELTDTLREIVARLEALGIDYMVVGSIAALAHGHSRSTQDFDVVIEVRPGKLRALVRSLPEDRFYVAEEAAMQALQHESLFNPKSAASRPARSAGGPSDPSDLDLRFNVIDMATGWKVDLIPRKQRSFSQTEFERRMKIDVLGSPMFVASIEDVIVAKLEWAKAGGGSQRQLEDVRALLRLAGDRLDRAYVEGWVAKLGLTSEWATVNA